MCSSLLQLAPGLRDLCKAEQIHKIRTLFTQNDEFVKGQIISKELFGVLEFSPKTNERIRRSSKNEFVCSFFGRI